MNGFGSGHHPLVLVGAAIFIVGLIYFIFIKNPQILNRLLRKTGATRAVAGQTDSCLNRDGPASRDIDYLKGRLN
jgi:hypothetical protein